MTIMNSTNPYKHGNRPSFCAGASVLLVMQDPKDNFRLKGVLAKDRDGEQKWSDFGGGAKHREKDFVCAHRELAEESHGLFSDVTPDRLHRASKVVFRFPSKKQNGKILHYTTFVIEIAAPGKDNPTVADLFRRAIDGLSPQELAQPDRAEKQDVQLIDLEQPADAVALRSFFKQRLAHLLPLLPEMMQRHTVHTVVLGKDSPAAPLAQHFRSTASPDHYSPPTLKHNQRVSQRFAKPAITCSASAKPQPYRPPGHRRNGYYHPPIGPQRFGRRPRWY